MSYTPPTDHEVEIMRAENRVTKWDRLASFAFSQRARDWAARMAARARADLKRLQEEKP